MRILVQKFGGSSLGTPQARRMALEKVIRAVNDGFRPVVVVSAMGRRGDAYATDTLIDLVKGECAQPAPRDLDIIMCCGEMISAVVMSAMLSEQGYETITLTGRQAGIVTNNNFGNANILRIDSAKMMAALREGRIPVVCGFQGVTSAGEIATLGRGGSDTTATALGATLKAELVEIYTDVAGIMTADPRLVATAKILAHVTYGEALQLAQQGAKIVHPRAVEIAMQKNIPIVVKSTFSDEVGTLIANVNPLEIDDIAIKDRIATGIAYCVDICQLSVRLDKESTHSESLKIFQAFAEKKINIDFINVHPGHVMFTIATGDLSKAVILLKTMDLAYAVTTDCAKVTVIGGGMGDVPGVMASFVEALASKDIKILQTVDSQNSISVLVKATDVKAAVTALHTKFGLGC